MLEVVEEKNIRRIKAGWEKLVSSENGLIYLTYPFHLAIYKSGRLFHFVQPQIMDVKYILVKENDSIRCILPIVIRKKTRKILFAGDWADAGYNDFIGGNEDDIIRIVEYINEKYGNEYCLELRDIIASSKINKVYPTEVQRQCYTIPASNGFDKWMESLKQRTRANIRRVYKRVESDCFDISFHIADKMKRRDIQKVCTLYYRHLEEITGEKRGNNRLSNLVLRYYKFTPMFNGLNKIDRCKLGYTTHNGKIISFDLFYVEPSEIIIPKGSYDTHFAKYKVGTFNLVELLKVYSEKGADINLSRGLFNYKVWLGGLPYPNYAAYWMEK